MRVKLSWWQSNDSYSSYVFIRPIIGMISQIYILIWLCSYIHAHLVTLCIFIRTCAALYFACQHIWKQSECTKGKKTRLAPIIIIMHMFLKEHYICILVFVFTILKTFSASIISFFFLVPNVVLYHFHSVHLDDQNPCMIVACIFGPRFS